MKTTDMHLFDTVSGATFIGLDTLTNVSLTGGKKNPMQGRVTKKVTGSSVMVFQNKKINGYAAMVERRLKDEGKNPATFKLGERRWGRRMPDSPFIEHFKDGVMKYYVEVIFLKAGTVEYFLDGNPIAESKIEGLKKATPKDDSQGGLDNKVTVRDYALDSIIGLRIDGAQYTF